MQMKMQRSFLPPRYVTGTVGKVVGIELDPNELPIHTHQSISEAGCVLLKFMPKCIYLEIPNTDDGFLVASESSAFQPATDMHAVIAVEPQTRTWVYRTLDGEQRVPVKRTQLPLLVHKLSTLHGVQGKTADPGICAHWKFPKNLSDEALWLAHYVILSRPRQTDRHTDERATDR